MRMLEEPSKILGIAVGAAAVCVALVLIGLQWEELGKIASVKQEQLPFAQGQEMPLSSSNPFVELLKLIGAGLIGIVVTAVQGLYQRDKPLGRSMVQAQILLCVSGAMMMVIIGGSLARALGIAGGASIIRFRTPVEDPRDTTILFLLMGLGMACGLGAFAVAGLGTAFLCVSLVILDRFGEKKPRVMMLELVADGKVFPVDHVHNILAGATDSYEPREVSEDKEASRKYLVTLDRGASLAYLSEQLMTPGTGIKSVTWEHPKKLE